VEEPITLSIEPKPMQSPSPYVQKRINESKRKSSVYDDIRTLIVKDVSGTITAQERAILSTYEVKC